MGIALDGALHWAGEPFESRFGEGSDTPVAGISLVHAALELELWIETFVDLPTGVVVRRVQVTNRSDRFRDLRLLFHHDLALSTGEPRESAFHDAASGGIVHHAGRRFALLNLDGPDGPGVPLWRLASRASSTAPGAEELPHGGRIEGPSEARGRVDSILAVPLPLPPAGAALVTVTIATGRTLEEARGRDESFRRAGAAASLASARAHWSLWLRQGERDLLDLPEDVASLYRGSLLALRLHQTPDGAILSGVEAEPALGALPEYRWCWHRDAAIAADALGRAGYHASARRYFEFTLRSVRETGALHAVVDAAGAPAAAAASWDALALPLWAFARHFERERDVEFAAPFYREVVIPTADRLAATLDPDTRLILSPDRWEGRVGFHAVVASAVGGGLRASAKLAAGFGDGSRARLWLNAADDIARALGRDLYRPEWGRFARSLTRQGRAFRPEPTLDASLLLLGLFDDFEPEDPRIRATVESVRGGLWVRTGVGGLARFEHDPLGEVGTTEIPGNPWIETSLWLAQHAVRTAARAQDLDAARTLLLWCAARSEGWGLLPEQLHPYRGETKAVSPSMAAHAWFVGTVVDYVERLRLLRRCEQCGAPAQARRETQASFISERSLPGLVGHL